MNILDIAIESAGGVVKLSRRLGVSQQVVSNWRSEKRRLPKPWEMVLRQKFARQIKAAQQ